MSRNQSKKLLDLMNTGGFDGLLISDPANVYYLRFHREGILLITEKATSPH